MRLHWILDVILNKCSLRSELAEGIRASRAKQPALSEAEGSRFLRRNDRGFGLASLSN
jgi:hypothetical protein